MLSFGACKVYVKLHVGYVRFIYKELFPRICREKQEETGCITKKRYALSSVPQIMDHKYSYKNLFRLAAMVASSASFFIK